MSGDSERITGHSEVAGTSSDQYRQTHISSLEFLTASRLPITNPPKLPRTPFLAQQAALDRLSPHDLPGAGSGVSFRDCYFGYSSEREHPSKTSSPCRSVEPRALPGVFFVLELNATP